MEKSDLAERPVKKPGTLEAFCVGVRGCITAVVDVGGHGDAAVLSCAHCFAFVSGPSAVANTFQASGCN